MKKLITILMIILLTGCSCNYELSIQNNKIYETLKINGVTNEIPPNVDLETLSNGNYTKNIIDDTVTYNSNYSMNNYKESNLLNCFDSYNIQSGDETYIIRTGKKFKCYPYQYNDFDVLTYDQLEIVIKTNHKVINHNATKVENNTYYWYIDDKNVNNAEIYFEIDKNIKNYDYIYMIILFLGILIIGGLIYYIANNKNKESNKL